MEEKNKAEKNHESEEELRKKLKEELRAELLEELKEEKKEKDKKSEDISPLKNPAISSSSKVHFDDYNSKELENINDMHRKERDLIEKKKLTTKKVSNEKKENVDSEAKAPKQQGSIAVMIVALILIVITIFLFPHVYRFFSQKNTKPDKLIESNNSSNEGPVYEKITVNSEVLKTFTYPIMRNSQYEKTSYYQKENITMSDFSNNDILYNAFIHVYTGSIGPYNGAYNENYCGTDKTRKSVNPKYLDARIENLFSRNTKYKHATFKVPSTNKDTAYVGTWVYDSKNNIYVYYGDCEGVRPTNTLYYDLKQIYEANGKSNNTVIDVSYYMGFAEVNATTKNYTIYSDASMSDVLTTGTLTKDNYESELEEVFNAYLQTNHSAKSYKYTFSSLNCSYQDYCFEKGEWVK